jgi:hypothetical protein
MYVASALTGESVLVSVAEIHLALARNPYFIPWLAERVVVLVVDHPE